MMGLSVGLLALSLVLSGCGGAVEPVATTISEAPSSTIASGCSGGDLQARSALLASAQAGEISVWRPTQLGKALEEVPPALLDGLLYVGCLSERIDELTFESMAWTNGIGFLLVIWQEWPGDRNLEPIPLGGAVHQAGVVQVSTVDQLVDDKTRTRIVHLFDGRRVVTAATFSLTTLSIERVEEVAWALYDAISVGFSSRDGIGVTRSFDELLAALRSVQLTIDDPVDVVEMSPFTATFGIAHATYRFVAAGKAITVFDFGGTGAADRAAATVSNDGYTIGHTPYDVVATPHYWQWDRLIVQFMGDDELVISRFDEVIGPAFSRGGSEG